MSRSSLDREEIFVNDSQLQWPFKNIPKNDYNDDGLKKIKKKTP